MRPDRRVLLAALLLFVLVSLLILFPPHHADLAYLAWRAVLKAAVYPVPLVLFVAGLYVAWRWGYAFRKELIIPNLGERIGYSKVVVDDDFIFFFRRFGPPIATLKTTVERLGGRVYAVKFPVKPKWDKDLRALVLNTAGDEVAEAIEVYKRNRFLVRENYALKKALLWWSRYQRPPEPPRQAEGGG